MQSTIRDEVLPELARLTRTLDDLARRVAAIEQVLAGPVPGPAERWKEENGTPPSEGWKL